VKLPVYALNPGHSVRAAVMARDADGDEVTPSAWWSSSDTRVAKVSPSGVVTAVAPGVAKISARTVWRTGATDIRVDAPAAAGSSNEPAGLLLIAHRSFDRKEEFGWEDDFSAPDGGSLAVVVDSSAPKSPPDVLRAIYPTGFTSAGTGPGSSELELPTKPRTLYVSFWGRLSSNWSGHDSKVNKEFYVYANGKPNVIMIQRAEYGDSIVPDFGLQDMAVGDTYDISPNLVPSAHIERGKWYHIEALMVGNTANKSDGTIDWWLDGKHIGSYKQLRFSDKEARFELFHYTTIWGGVGGPNVPATQYKDWDDVYLSGR
jgi:hypothetical protein